MKRSLILAAPLALAFALSAQADPITVVSWGGAYTKSQIEGYHKPFIRDTGININSVDYNGGLAEIKAQVETGNVTWDVVDVEKSEAIQGCDEGLFEEVDFAMLPDGTDGTPAMDDFVDGSLIEPCAVGNISWSTVYAFDSSKWPSGGAPSTIQDFCDVQKFPGKRGLRKGAKATLEVALMCDGVPASQVYDTLRTPAGVNRAFASLDRIKDHVLWWEAGSQPPQLLADGEVAMTTAYNGRIFNAAVDEGKPFVIVWDGQILDYDFYVIPKGTKNLESATKFLFYSTGTVPLAAQASYIAYGPVRLSSAPHVGKHAATGVEMAPHMPTAPDNLRNALASDHDFWADHVDELNERFNAWLAG